MAMGRDVALKTNSLKANEILAGLHEAVQLLDGAALWQQTNPQAEVQGQGFFPNNGAGSFKCGCAALWNYSRIIVG